MKELKRLKYPIAVIIGMLLSPWINWILVHNILIADPSLSFSGVRDAVWVIQALATCFIIPALCGALE